MSKPALMGVLFLWLVIITFIVNAVITYDNSTDLAINNPLQNETAQADDGILAQSTSLLATYWNAITFNVEGLPIIFNLFFQVPTVIITFMLLEFIIELIPF